MCLEAICENPGCGKKTWFGCGKHRESVMQNISEEDKCRCDETGVGAKPARPANAPAGAVDTHYRGPQP